MTIIRLCRFNSNKELSLSPQDINHTPYVAISHVWGKESEISYHSIPGIPTEVPLSTQKAAFLSTQLASLIGESYFWMDVLAVDQSSAESRASVVKHIPEIYRRAKYTLIVREQGGLQECCIRNLNFEDSNEFVTGMDIVMDKWRVMERHLKEAHPEGLQEVWMERNWPLQELSLSHTVRFTVCEQAGKRERLFGEGNFRRFNVGVLQTHLLEQELRNMARRWAGAGDASLDTLIGIFSVLGLSQDSMEMGSGDLQHREEIAKRFMEAVVSNGEVTRLPYSQLEPSLSNLLTDCINSTRRTGKARDFILAIFPQFQWYALPPSLRSLSFSFLFRHCMSQIQGLQAAGEDWQSIEDFQICSKLTEGILKGLDVNPEESKVPSCDVPEPISLGDFCKLIHIEDNTIVHEGEPPESYSFLQPVHTSECSINRVISLLSDTLWYADQLVIQSFFAQLAVWNTDKKQLLDLICGGDTKYDSSTNEISRAQNHSDSEWEREKNLRENALKTIDAINFLSNILTLFSLRNLGPLMANAQANIRAQNPILSDFEAQNLREPAPIEEEWAWLRSQFLAFDSAGFRDTLLLTTTLCCGFGMSPIPWLREKLQIYALKCIQEEVEMETLVFAAKGLDTDLLNNEFKVEAYVQGWEPYVLVRSGEGVEVETRVVGLTPRKGQRYPNPYSFADEDA